MEFHSLFLPTGQFFVDFLGGGKEKGGWHQISVQVIFFFFSLEEGRGREEAQKEEGGTELLNFPIHPSNHPPSFPCSPGAIKSPPSPFKPPTLFGNSFDAFFPLLYTFFLPRTSPPCLGAVPVVVQPRLDVKRCWIFRATFRAARSPVTFQRCQISRATLSVCQTPHQ